MRTHVSQIEPKKLPTCLFKDNCFKVQVAYSESEGNIFYQTEYTEVSIIDIARASISFQVDEDISGVRGLGPGELTLFDEKGNVLSILSCERVQ